MFGRGNVYVELISHDEPADDERNDALFELAAATGLPVVASSNVHYASPSQARLAQALAAIRARRSLAEMDGWLAASGGAFIRSGAEMAARLNRYPGVQQRTVALARDCAWDFTVVAPALPDFPVPDGSSEARLLRDLVERRAPARYGPRHAERVDGAYAQIDRELAVIEELEFPGYFLIVYDIVRFCEESGILCQGRGSAANSAVCYAIGITSVDPVRHGLLFERFLSAGRDGPPDIDLDIEHNRREAVIQYVYATYGRDRAAQVANVISYRPRMALRDAGRALGYPPAQLDQWSRQVGPREYAPGQPVPPDAGIPPDVIELAGQLQQLPRHLGIHSGGMVICDRPVGEVCPVEWARMPGRTVLQWDKDDCAYAGLVKFDLLGLGMLAALRDCFGLIEHAHGVRWTLESIPQEDAGVYAMLQAADTVGVFQVESRAQMATLPRLRPERFYDLVIEVALIRPGPIQGGSVHPYMRRRHGDEPPDLPHPSMRRALAKTLGVPLFQEQMMQVAIDCAGFSPAEADRLRQAMSSKRAPERIEELRHRLLGGMAERGIPGGRGAGHLHEDPRVLQLRLPRVARDQLRLPGLRQRLAEVLLPGRVHRRAAAQPADGLLLAGHAPQRRPAARGHGDRRRRQRQRRAGHPPANPRPDGLRMAAPGPLRPARPGSRAGRGRLAAVPPRSPPAAYQSLASRRSGSASPACATSATPPPPPSRPASRTRTWRTSPAARRCRSRRWRRWPPRARSAASASAAARRSGRQARRRPSGPVSCPARRPAWTPRRCRR